ncbi:hypothetical protein [Streptomyces sp. YKOK-I1]
MRGDQLGHQVRLLHDVLCDIPRTGHGTASRLRTAFDARPADAPPGRVAEPCRAAAWLDLLHVERALARAPAEIRDRFRLLPTGTPTEIGA